MGSRSDLQVTGARRDHVVSTLRQFLRHPWQTGAVRASSDRLAAGMVDNVPTRPGGRVLEIGAGTGAFTRALSVSIPPDVKILAVEVNPVFAAALARGLAADPRVDIVRADAHDLLHILPRYGMDAADAVVCGLPWAAMRHDRREELLDVILAVLAPGGEFRTFAYLHALWTPAARRLHYSMLCRFRSVERSAPYWRNTPPAVVYRCRSPRPR